MKKRLFSGSAPSGNLTIGNYIGALKQWKHFEKDYDSLFCIVDMHAITVPQDAALLKERTLNFFTQYVAVGLDPHESTIFIQSHNPAHAELTWILNCLTPFGQLSRMTQFKDKSKKHKTVNVGLFDYPVLMAADILLYDTHFVPVGEDQKQHIELTRDIAEKFNHQHGSVFVIPEGFIPKIGGKIKNLQEPDKKMDKSNPVEKTYIALIEDADSIVKKIKKAKTDAEGSFDISDENGGIANLVNIMSALTAKTPQDIRESYIGSGYAGFKSDLAEIVVEALRPVRERYFDLRNNDDELQKLIKLGAEKAIERSQEPLARVKEAIGFIRA